MPENHPLAVGWGYGPQGTRTAEAVRLFLRLRQLFPKHLTGRRWLALNPLSESAYRVVMRSLAEMRDLTGALVLQ